MCKALNEMMEDSRRDGRRDGIRIGERNGEQKFAALAGRLMADSRKLYREYGMK